MITYICVGHIICTFEESKVVNTAFNWSILVDWSKSQIGLCTFTPKRVFLVELSIFTIVTSGSEVVAVFIYLVKIPNMVCWLHRVKIIQ
jgi:hypothetical protein